MKKIFLILCATVAVFATSNAQSLHRLKQGLTADTIRQSTTIYTNAVNVNSNQLQALILQVAADSVSGSPAPKFVLQRSTDGRNWKSIAGDTLTCTITGGVGTVSQQLNVNPFYGTYARVKIYTSATAQKSKIWVTIKSFLLD